MLQDFEYQVFKTLQISGQIEGWSSKSSRYKVSANGQLRGSYPPLKKHVERGSGVDHAHAADGFFRDRLIKSFFYGIPINVREKRIDVFFSFGWFLVEREGVLPKIHDKYFGLSPAMFPSLCRVIQ